MRIIKPPRLKRGDVIGVIAPSGPLHDTARLERGVRYLEHAGYRVEVGRAVTRVEGYLAGTDAERLADLHLMFANKQVKGIIAVRGGYGSTRLLPRIEFSLLRRNPKIFVGFSDITALHLALWKKCRLVTFHGPMLSADMTGDVDPDTEEHFWRAVTSGRSPQRIRLSASKVRVLQPGVAVGRLLGGNLSLLCSLHGTDFLPDFARSILFIEEIGEEPYRVDRMVTQLSHSGIIGKAKGVLAGHFTKCVSKDPRKPSQSVDAVLRELADHTGRPFLANISFGHIRGKITLPIGIQAQISSHPPRLDFLESAVV